MRTPDQFDPIESARDAYFSRIANKGYPTAEVYVDNDDEWRINWWSDDAGDELLEIARFLEIDDLDAAEHALAKTAERDKRIVKETLKTLRDKGTLNDLIELIDAASEQGSAKYSENSAGYFLATIAQMAWSQIKGGSSNG